MRTRVLSVLSFLAVGISCGSHETTSPAHTTSPAVASPVAQVVVSAEQNGSVAVGGLAYVEVTAFDASGDTVSGLPISWSSSSALIATIAQSTPAYRGVVTAVTPGSATISATVGGVSGSTLVTVVPLSAVASLTVRPSTVTFVAGPTGFGSNSQITAAASDANGNGVLGVPVIWTVSDPTAATVSSTGLITPSPVVLGGSMVKATVTAAAAGLSASVPIIVCPEVASITVSTTAISLQVGQSIVVAATALDAHGNLELAPLASETVYPSGIIVSIDHAGFDSLRVTGTAAGTASLHFHDNTGGAQSQTISISVTGALSAARDANRLGRASGLTRLARDVRVR